MLITANPQEGDIDLRDDPLYVFVDGRWGTVSSDAWTTANSRVACRQMGYSIADSSTRKNYYSALVHSHTQICAVQSYSTYAM